MTGLEIPGAAPGIAVSLDGKAAALGPSVELQWDKGAVAGREIGGRVTVAAAANGTPRFDGDLSVDSIDLGWLTELSLGVDPLPTGDPAAPWSKASFTEPVLGALSGKVNVAAPRMTVEGRLRDLERQAGADPRSGPAADRPRFRRDRRRQCRWRRLDPQCRRQRQPVRTLQSQGGRAGALRLAARRPLGRDRNHGRGRQFRGDRPLARRARLGAHRRRHARHPQWRGALHQSARGEPGHQGGRPRPGVHRSGA